MGHCDTYAAFQTGSRITPLLQAWTHFTVETEPFEAERTKPYVSFLYGGFRLYLFQSGSARDQTLQLRVYGRGILLSSSWWWYCKSPPVCVPGTNDHLPQCVWNWALHKNESSQGSYERTGLCISTSHSSQYSAKILWQILDNLYAVAMYHLLAVTVKWMPFEPMEKVFSLCMCLQCTALAMTHHVNKNSILLHTEVLKWSINKSAIIATKTPSWRKLCHNPGGSRVITVCGFIFSAMRGHLSWRPHMNGSFSIPCKCVLSTETTLAWSWCLCWLAFTSG